MVRRSPASRDSASTPAVASDWIESVVTHVARFVSIGQLPSSPHRSSQELSPARRHWAIRLPGAGQTHEHEARQRRCFQKPAAGWLDALQDPLRAAVHRPAQHAQQRVARRSAVMTHLPNGDQGRQCVAHNRHMQESKPRLRECRQLEGQLRYALPCLGRGAQPAGQCAHGENRHGERPVVTIATGDRARQRARVASAGGVV